MNKSIISILALGIFVGIGILLLPGLNQSSEEKTAHLINNSKPQGGNFTLNTAKGEVSLDDLKGKLVLAYFGYTFCPDICPTNLGNISMAYRQLTDAEKAKIQIVFISVDPVRDTPDRLKEYADYFDMNAIAGTSDPKTIATTAHQYGVVYLSHQKSASDDHYAVDHSAFTYIINQNGQLKIQLPHATSPDDFLKNIRYYLANKPA